MEQDRDQAVTKEPDEVLPKKQTPEYLAALREMAGMQNARTSDGYPIEWFPDRTAAPNVIWWVPRGSWFHRLAPTQRGLHGAWLWLRVAWMRWRVSS